MRKTPLIVPFLRALVSGTDRFDIRQLPPRTLGWAIECGLGPLLHHCSRNDDERASSEPFHSLLLAADRTARVYSREIRNALLEILRQASSISIHPILLKGACTRYQLYAEPHLRTMGDIDILVPRSGIDKLTEVLLNLGYRQQSDHPPRYFLDHHHEMPFFHPGKHVWIELHTALFHPTANAARDCIFQLPHLTSQSRPFSLDGFTANCLPPDLLLLHTCSHWAEVMNRGRGIMGLVDTALLIQITGDKLNWDRLLADVDKCVSAAHLFLVLRYLFELDVVDVPREVMHRLQRTQRHLNDLNISALSRLIDAYQLEGRPFGRFRNENVVSITWNGLLAPHGPWRNLLSVPWNIAFPPNMRHRYSFSYQLRRLTGLFKQQH